MKQTAVLLILICFALTGCKKKDAAVVAPTQSPAAVDIDEEDDSDGHRSYFGGYSFFGGYFKSYGNGQCVFEDNEGTILILACTVEEAEVLAKTEGDRLGVDYYDQAGIAVYSGYEVYEKAYESDGSIYFTGHLIEFDGESCFFGYEGEMLEVSCTPAQAKEFEDTLYTIEYTTSEDGIEVLGYYAVETINEDEYSYTTEVAYEGGTPGGCAFWLYENYDGYDGSTITFNCSEEHWRTFERDRFNIFLIEYDDDSVITSIDTVGRLPEKQVVFLGSEDGLCSFDEGSYKPTFYCNGFSDFPDTKFTIYYIPNVIDDYPVLMGIRE